MLLAKKAFGFLCQGMRCVRASCGHTLSASSIFSAAKLPKKWI